jgi:integrase
VDSTRAPTRKGAKKAQPVSLTPEQAARLKAQPDTPQGRRDALLLGLLLDYGLRVGEVAGLQIDKKEEQVKKSAQVSRYSDDRFTIIRSSITII